MGWGWLICETVSSNYKVHGLYLVFSEAEFAVGENLGVGPISPPKY